MPELTSRLVFHSPKLLMEKNTGTGAGVSNTLKTAAQLGSSVELVC